MTGIYIHWPFCIKKCPYCDFNSHVVRTIDQKVWLKHYLKDLNDYLCIEFTIDYSFDLEIDEGDYWTPPYTEIIDREVLVGVYSVRLEENGYNFSNEFYGVVESFIEDYVKSYF